MTREPFHTANAPFQKEMQPNTDTPVTVCSVAELEHLVALRDLSVSQLLGERLADPLASTYSLDIAFRGRNLARNAILNAGWDSYPWKRHADLGRGAAADPRVV
ncbi:hypothetical protein [Streptomyces violaceoruber]|uniref:Uncharacterized protein n=1 Tax=Streptomyces violaceoruber TaxID=1935 RepID=A0ACD4X058_STRVN|nr:hypothetical protein R2E43_38875 [Streptomyces violaceoruber]